VTFPKRIAAAFTVVALHACSGGGAPTGQLPARPAAPSSAPADPTSATRATFTIHWSASAQSQRRRNTISASTQSISVSVNGGVATVVNKPTTSGSPASTSVSIPAPAGSDAFSFTAWDQVGGTGNILDQTIITQDIIANENNAISVVLDGVCAALVPSLSAPSIYAETTTATTQLASTTRTILKSARLVGNVPQSIAFTPVDADGNTILAGAGTTPITVTESGPTPHVAIAPNATTAANTVFKITPLVAEPDGVTTQLTATSPNCGAGTAALPSSLTLSTSAAIYVADITSGNIDAFDQDGTQLAVLANLQDVTALAYNSKSNYFVAFAQNSTGESALFEFQTFTPTGTSLGSGYFTPTGFSPINSYEEPPFPYSASYDPANGFFAVSITGGSDSKGNAVAGNVAFESISGSSATNEPAAFTGLSYPYTVAVLPNGNIAVADFGNSQVDVFAQSGKLVFSTSAKTPYFAVDSQRGNLLGQIETTNASTGADSFPGVAYSYAQGLGVAASYALPFDTANYYEAVGYSAGNDELYLFNNEFGASSLYGINVGVSGSAIYSGGSSVSNLPAGAFASIVDASAFVAIP
jgi:hypothetical protein